MEKIVNINFLQSRWRIFVLSFLAGLLMVALPFFGIKSPLKLASPLSIKPVDSFEKVKTKLERVKSNLSLIENSYASSGEVNSASAYAVLDLNSTKLLLEKNFSERLPIASLTKIMTAIVSLDLLDKKELIEVNIEATEVEPTNMGLIQGQIWSLEDLLHGLILTSSNDVAELIRLRIDAQYGEGTFIKAMNTKASFLGLKNTHFENPQGYDSVNNYSSVEDLANLSFYAIKNYPTIAEIAKKDYQFFPESENHKQADLYNWNGLLGVYPGILGLKIGNTEAAQKTTIVLAEREGKQILVVLLGAPGVLERDLWASQLLDLGFEKLGVSKVGITESQLKQKYSSWKYF